jgi:hypothetical protein
MYRLSGWHKETGEWFVAYVNFLSYERNYHHKLKLKTLEGVIIE